MRRFATVPTAILTVVFLIVVCSSEPIPIAEQFTPVEWGISPSDNESRGPGVYTVFMEVDAGPLIPAQVEDVSGQLIWDETAVDLCNINIDLEYAGWVYVGDTFDTIEGCGVNPAPQCRTPSTSTASRRQAA